MGYSLQNLKQNWLSFSSEFGGSYSGAAKGPGFLTQHLLQEFKPLSSQDYFQELSELKPEHVSTPDKLSLWLEVSRHQQEVVLQNFSQSSHKQVIFSAEHSLALGNLAGLRAANPKARIGVIWIDAHADLHSPGTSPSQNPHGMPLAAALGLDHRSVWEQDLDFHAFDVWKDLQSLMMGQFISTRDLVYVGLRDLEDAELYAIQANQIRVYSVEQSRKLGMSQLALQIRQYLQDCDILYVSWDLDSLDAQSFSSTGLPVEDGFHMLEARDLLKGIFADPRVKCFEMTELYPAFGHEIDKQSLLSCLRELLPVYSEAQVEPMNTTGFVQDFAASLSAQG